MSTLSVLSFLKSNWLLLILVSAVLGFIAIHIVWYIHPSDVKSVEDLNQRLTSGQPAVVTFHSNL